MMITKIGSVTAIDLTLKVGLLSGRAETTVETSKITYTTIKIRYKLTSALQTVAMLQENLIQRVVIIAKIRAGQPVGAGKTNKAPSTRVREQVIEQAQLAIEITSMTTIRLFRTIHNVLLNTITGVGTNLIIPTPTGMNNLTAKNSEINLN